MPAPILAAIAKAGAAAAKAASVAKSIQGAVEAGGKGEGASIGTALANPASALAGSTEEVTGAFGKKFPTDRKTNGFDDSLAPR